MSDGVITLFGLGDRSGWEAATAGSETLPSQTWAYARGLAAAGLTPQLAVVEAGEARLVLPFHERSFQGFTDIATLPGLSGASIHPASSAPLALWRDYAAGRGWVCGYLQLSISTGALAVAAPDDTMSRNALFVFDLATWAAERSPGHNMRKTLRRGEREGAVFCTDRDWLAEVFPALHAQAMARVGEAPVFPPETLAIWADDPDVRFIGGGIDGQIEVAGLCRMRNGIAEGHLAGSTDAGRGLHAWLFARSAAWFATLGVRYYNIGGYGQPGDGLHMMKARLAATEHPLRAIRQIYRPDLFDSLCRAAGVAADAAYFPPNRTPGA